MRIVINEDGNRKDTEVIINTPAMDERIERVVSFMRLADQQVTARRGNEIFLVDAVNIVYFESVEDRTFFYTSDGTFETKLRLYEIEDRFSGTDVMRISKSVIVNLDHVVSILPVMNGCIELSLDNGNRAVVSRHHSGEFRKKIGL